MPDATPDQQHRQQHRRDAHDWATLFVLTLTLIAAGCAAGFTGWQAWIARDQEHRALRAYVVVNAELLVGQEGKSPYVKIPAENMGQTPVYNLTFNTWNSVIEAYEDIERPSLLKIDCRDMFPITRLGRPGITFSKSTVSYDGLDERTASFMNWTAMFQKFRKVLIYGTVCYRDAQVSPHFFRCNFNDIGVGSDQLLCISPGESAPIDFKEW